jgi:hypothetical protein
MCQGWTPSVAKFYYDFVQLIPPTLLQLLPWLSSTTIAKFGFQMILPMLQVVVSSCFIHPKAAATPTKIVV